MKDPTYGRIDPDIQRTVDEIGPKSLGQRVAMENTLQARRDARGAALRCPDCAAEKVPHWCHARRFLRALTGRRR